MNIYLNESDTGRIVNTFAEGLEESGSFEAAQEYFDWFLKGLVAASESDEGHILGDNGKRYFLDGFGQPLDGLKYLLETAEESGWGLEIDWAGLPTFGGEDIIDTSETWSWDATHALVGTCADDLQVIPREDLA